MKKIIALLLALAMVLAMTACGSKPATEPAPEEVPDMPGMPSPMIEFESLEALNAEYGTKLTHPGVMGVTDETFFGIRCNDYDIAQYEFTVGGTEYCLRYAPTDEDISGIYVGEGTLFSNFDGPANASSENYFGARWFTLDGQYCLTCPSDNIDSGTFASIAEEIENLTATANTINPPYEDLVGSYQDSFSQRASAEVFLEGDGVTVDVVWGSSATEADEWYLPCTFGEDGLLYYIGGVHNRMNFDTDEMEVIADGLDGWFEVDENYTLYWTGASEDDCLECVFEKMPE